MVDWPQSAADGTLGVVKLRRVALAVWMSAACSREEEAQTTATPEEVAASCEAGYAARARADEASCACEVEAGVHVDLPACLAEIGVPYAPTCFCDIVAAEPGDADAAMCTAEAAEALADCVEPLTCAQASGREACRLAYLRALAMCEPLGRRSRAEVEIQCLGAPAIACSSGEAIPAAWVCDGAPDCADMSDESDCEFQCGDGEAVPIGFQCDGEPDCADMSDEDGCEFQCGSGEAVPLPVRCDGTADCMDMSDEAECDGA